MDAAFGLLGAGNDRVQSESLGFDQPGLRVPNRTRRTLRRSDDPRTVDYTDVLDLTGIDDGGNVGEYAFYFDISYTPDPLSGRWLLGTPSAGGVPVMAGTSPTSWYTTPENVQHVAYVGTDQLVHECFYFIGGDGRWFQGTPSAGGVPVMPGTSPTSWYTTPENVQHVAYVGTDQLVHECFYFIGGDGRWFQGTPSAGGVPVMPGTSPTSWYTTPENVQHVAYVGTDQQVHECFYFIGGDGRWFQGTPSAGGVPVMPGTSPTSWYTTPENVQHVAYVGTDQQVHECFYFIGGDGRWFQGTPSAGGVPVMPGTSPTSWYTTPENVQHVAYVGVDQQVHECFYFIGGDGRWFQGTPSAGGVPVMPGTSPTSWYTTPENVQHLAYVGVGSADTRVFLLHRRGRAVVPGDSVGRWGAGDAGDVADELVHDAGECAAHRLCRHRPAGARELLPAALTRGRTSEPQSLTTAALLKARV